MNAAAPEGMPPRRITTFHLFSMEDSG